MQWDQFVKKYIWDDERTPYFAPARRLSRRQADYEIFAYAVFLGVLFGVFALASVLDATPDGGQAAVYAWSMILAAVVLSLSKHFYAALYCATAPPAALLYFYAYGFHPNLADIDHALLTGFAVLWLVYAWRVVAIARAYPDMPERHPEG